MGKRINFYLRTFFNILLGAILSFCAEAAENTDFFSTYSDRMGISFVVEKVTKDNIKNWRAYCNNQTSIIDNMGSKNIQTPLAEQRSSVCLNSFGALSDGFIPRLNLYNQCDLRVAYVFDKKSTAQSGTQEFDNIEMAFLIFMARDVPFQIHMGIHRNVGHLSTHETLHPNISCLAHAYGALIGQTLYPENICMVTTPVEAMRNILVKNLPADAWWEGNLNPQASDYRENAAIFQRDYKNEYDFILYDKRNVAPSPVIFEVHYREPLWENEKTFTLNPLYEEERKAYKWVFSAFLWAPYFAIDLGKLASTFIS